MPSKICLPFFNAYI